MGPLEDKIKLFVKVEHSIAHKQCLLLLVIKSKRESKLKLSIILKWLYFEKEELMVKKLYTLITVMVPWLVSMLYKHLSSPSVVCEGTGGYCDCHMKLLHLIFNLLHNRMLWKTK